MLMSKKELENKCKDLESRLSKLEKAFDNIKNLYDLCNIKFFDVTYEIGRDSKHVIVKIDMLNKKFYMYSFYDLDSILNEPARLHISECSLLNTNLLIFRLAVIRKKDSGQNVLEFNIDENLNENLLNAEMYAFIISNFKKYRNFTVNGFSSNIEYVNTLEEKLVEGTRAINQLKGELDKYKKILKNL